MVYLHTLLEAVLTVAIFCGGTVLVYAVGVTIKRAYRHINRND